MRVFFNEDAFHFWMTRCDANVNVTEKVLREFIYQYKDTAITDFALNVNFTTSVTQSDVFDDFYKKYYRKHENGVDVDYSNDYPKLLHGLQQQGIDPYAVFVNSLREIGINPWLSVRMDDVHHLQDNVHLWKAQEIEQQRDRWITSYRDGNYYFDKCRNYLLPQVRNDYLSYIGEQLGRYDVYGIELDFSREPYCFPFGKQSQGRNVMTDFVRSVRRIVDEIAQKRNKKVYLSIVCQANPQTAYNNGFDVSQMAQSGLVDFVVASPRWATINTDIPVELWKKLLPSGVMLGCNQQLLVRPCCSLNGVYVPDVYASFDMDYGQAYANVCRGADFVYLYNHFDTVERRVLNAPHSTSFRNSDLLKQVLQNIGDKNKLAVLPRRIPVTFDDFVNGYENIVGTLPVKRNGIVTFRIPTGKITDNQSVYFTFRSAEQLQQDDVTVYVNGSLAKPCISVADENIVQGNLYSFVVETSADVDCWVEVITKKLVEITYAEILINTAK